MLPEVTVTAKAPEKKTPTTPIVDNNDPFLGIIASRGGGFLNDGVWQIGLNGNISVGVGVALEVGIAVDFKEGFHVSPYFSLSQTWGVDLSAGGKITYNKPINNSHFGTANLQGWGESNNVAIWIFDPTYGGDSFNPGLNLNKFNHYFNNTYESYGFGASVGLPLGVTRSKGFTWVFFKH